MRIVKWIKQKLYDFFHPSTERLTQEFAIAEKLITREEYEKCIKLLDELFGEHEEHDF